MSGIAGAYYRDGREIARSTLEPMMASMAHRGPDGMETWYGRSVGFGHLMLHTTPESVTERLPRVDESGRFVITADAHLDNRNELLGQLGIDEANPGEIPDSELMLRAYQSWGELSPDRLLGDYAYCVWDRVKQRLFCCRDPFGVRPLYYYLSDKLFAFASEITSLLALPQVPKRLNEIMVADYLVGSLADQSITFYEHILRLPPGQSLVVSSRSTRKSCYWSLAPTVELRLNSDDQYAEHFRDLFVQAVRSRLRGEFPVAASLSGGLDSSSIVCVARDLVAKSSRPRQLDALSLVYDEVEECDERDFIAKVLDGGGVKPIFFTADRAVPLPYFQLDEMYDHDDPFDAPNSFSLSGMATLKGNGIRIYLDGFDGDNTISHCYAFLSELAYRGNWIRLIREARALSSRQNKSLLDLLWRKAVRPLTPAPVRRSWRRLTGCRNRPWPRAALILPEFAERIGLAQRYREIHAYELKPLRDARKDHCHSVCSGELTHHLESMNKIGARFSVEARHPFFDRRLVEFCVAIPHEQKIRDGWTRLVMRRAMAGILPDEIRWRTDKIDFRPSFYYAVSTMDGSMREDLVRRTLEAVTGFVDAQAFERQYGSLLANPRGQDPSFLWFTLSLGLWLERSGLKP